VSLFSVCETPQRMASPNLVLPHWPVLKACLKELVMSLSSKMSVVMLASFDPAFVSFLYRNFLACPMKATLKS
jgi:hypothetical protein